MIDLAMHYTVIYFNFGTLIFNLEVKLREIAYVSMVYNDI